MEELYAKLEASDIIVTLGLVVAFVGFVLPMPVLWHARPYVTGGRRGRIQGLRLGQAFLLLMTHMIVHTGLAKVIEELAGFGEVLAAIFAIGPMLLADLVLLALFHTWLVLRLRAVASPPEPGDEAGAGVPAAPSLPFLHGRARERLLALGALLFLVGANLPHTTFVRATTFETNDVEHYTQLSAWWIPSDYSLRDGTPNEELNTWLDTIRFLRAHELMLFAMGLFVLSFLWLSRRSRGAAVGIWLLVHLAAMATLSLGYVMEGGEASPGRLAGEFLRILAEAALFGGLAAMSIRLPVRGAAIAVIAGGLAILIAGIATPILQSVSAPDPLPLTPAAFLPIATLVILLPLLLRNPDARAIGARIALAIAVVFLAFLAPWLESPAAVLNGPVPQFFGSMGTTFGSLGLASVGLCILSLLPRRVPGDDPTPVQVDRPWLTPPTLLGFAAVALLVLMLILTFLVGRKVVCRTMCTTIWPEGEEPHRSKMDCYDSSYTRADLTRDQMSLHHQQCEKEILGLDDCREHCTLFVGPDYPFTVGEPRSDLWPNYELR